MTLQYATGESDMTLSFKSHEETMLTTKPGTWHIIRKRKESFKTWHKNFAKKSYAQLLKVVFQKTQNYILLVK